MSVDAYVYIWHVVYIARLEGGQVIYVTIYFQDALSIYRLLQPTFYVLQMYNEKTRDNLDTYAAIPLYSKHS